MKKLVILLLLLLLISGSALACRQAEPVAPQEPVVTLLSPGNGDTLTSGDVEVRIYLQNFKMVGDTGQPNQANEGHAIFYLDASAPTERGMPATSAPGTFVESTQTSYTWPNLSPGEHTFSVQLVHNDSTPLYGPCTVRANVRVKSP